MGDGPFLQDDDAAVSDGIEEMSEADETDSDSDEYVPSLEDSDMLRRAPLVARTYDQVKSQIACFGCVARRGRAPRDIFALETK